jgi:hypothetical protein
MLFFRVIFALLAYDVVSATCRFERIYSIAKSWKVASRAADPSLVDRVCTAVNHACIWYPKQVLCLQRSIVTTYMLRKYGISAQLILGAQKLPFKAHAWVEVDGGVINERSDIRATYVVWDRW